jgi:hypothetical protein
MRWIISCIAASCLCATYCFAFHAPTIIKAANGKKYYTGLILEDKKTAPYGKTFAKFDDCDNLPAEFDLRDLGVVPKIRDQGQCGSCWSQSKTSSIMSAIAMTTGGVKDELSTQELVSCDKQNYGCQGGLLNQNEYQASHGQGKESDFPYTGRDSACKQITSVAKLTKFVYVGQSGRTPTDKELMCAVYKTKTIPWIVVSAGDNWATFPSASDGVVSTCRNSQPNHAVGVVGWKTVNGQVYFKMRNSWGNQWGSDAGRPGMERGYAMMKLGCDKLGYEVAYATVPGAPTPGPTPPNPPTPGPTPPGPCTAPTPKLPMFAMIRANDTVYIGVEPQTGVKYTWNTSDGRVSGEGNPIRVGGVTGDTTLTVTAKNDCATAESMMKIVIAPLKKKK